MPISITSLTPSKDATSVFIDSNIEIEITSTDLDLDPTTVQFYINGIQVQPSAYYGASETIVDVTFYSKKRIKYQNRRYGQEDFRYGQSNIYPSVFEYGKRYVCTVAICDIKGNKFEENFAFDTEDGIFYNQKSKHYYYSQQAQALANYLPPESRARYDKYSNFQQLVNPTCNYLEEVNSFLYKQLANYYVQTANLNELSTLYRVKLGEDYEFSTIVLDDGKSLQIPPEITALKGITRYSPSSEFNNNIKDFYYNKLPTRLDENKIPLNSFELCSERSVEVNAIKLNKKLEREGTLCLSIKDGTKFTNVRNNKLDILICRITGISREGEKQSEDITIIDNDNYFTLKFWSEVRTIQFMNIPDSTDIKFTISYGRPSNSFVLDSFKAITVDDQEKPVFWKKAENDSASVLQQYGLLKTDIEDIISSLAEKDLLIEYELLDVDNQTRIDIADIETNTFTNFLFGVNNEYLYIFDKRDTYPEIIKELPSSNGTANMVIDLVTNELARESGSKLIEFVGMQKTIGKEIAQYRFKIRKPDGSFDYINEESEIVTKEKAGIIGSPLEVQIKTKNIKYHLTEPGDYIIYLETIYRDGSTDIDGKIARVPTKAALAKYKLSRLLRGATVQNIFTDFDQQLKIYDSNQELHIIRFAKDNVLIDYSNAILLFNEGYDEVEVIDG